MGFIEEMAKAKMYDEIQTRQVSDAMNAASIALREQKAKEANMDKLFQEVVRNAQGGLATSAGQPIEPEVGLNIAPPAQSNIPAGLGANMAGKV